MSTLNDLPPLDRFDALRGWADSFQMRPPDVFMGAIAPAYEAGYAWQLRTYLHDPTRCAPIEPQKWYGYRRRFAEQTMASLQRYYDNRDAEVAAAHEAVVEAQRQLLGGDSG